MYRLLAVTLAIVGLTVRSGAGFESLAPCEPILCGCEPVPVAVCCESASEPMPAPPRRPQAPMPAQQRPAPEPLPPAAGPSAPETPLPADAPPSEPAPEDEQSEPTEPAEPMPFEELFSDESAEEPSPTDQQPPAESAPAESEPASGEDGPADDAEADAPEAEELFTPTGALREPGGWSSNAARAWTDAGGRELHSARLSGANAEQVTLVDGDGVTHTVRYAELSDGDLRFLRRQIEARRALLAPPADELLANEGR